MKKIILLLLIVFTFLISSFSLSLEEAKELALKNNPELLSKIEAKRSSNWSLFNSRLDLFPGVSLSGSYMEYDPTIPAMSPPFEQVSAESFSLVVSQPVFNGGKIWLGSGIQRDLSEIASHNLTSQELKTISEVESKYFSVLEMSEFLKIAELDLKLAQLNLGTAEVRYKLGTISRAEYLNMKSQVASKEVTLIQTQNRYELSILDLSKFLQIPKDFTVEPLPLEQYEDWIESVRKQDQGSFQEILNQVLEIAQLNNPTLKISDLSTSMKLKSLKMAKGNFLPSVNLSYSKSWDKADYEEDYSDQSISMVTVSIPIFSYANHYAEYQKAKHDLEESKYSTQSTQDNITLLIEQSFYNLISSARMVYSAKIALDFAEETYEQMSVRYQNNIISSQDLLDVEILLTSSRNQYINSYYDFLRAKSSLLNQMGEKNENILFKLFN
ncbi:TolC family protein [Candidatus Dependentiae bacterium]|nr:TolC family protein [Candidatus Dependentiae bacterium]